MKIKFLLITALLTLSKSVSAQSHNLVGEWSTNAVIGYENLNEYKLYKQDSEFYVYGNRLKLNDDLTYESYYTAPCGNDCFPSTYGKYKITENEELHFQVDSLVVRGFCKNLKKTFKDNVLNFQIMKQDLNGKDELVLVKK